MQIKRKLIRLLCVVLAMAFMLTGCEFATTDISDLMRPPKLTGEQQAVQLALEKAVGTKYTLKYPLGGDIRSAFIMHDIDGDGKKEALALYCPSNENAGTHIMILKQFNGRWKKFADINGQGNEVERIDFGKYDGDGIDYLTVGWTLFSSTDFGLGVYKLTKTGVDQLFNGGSGSSFTEMTVFPESGKRDDILLIKLDSANKLAQARLLRYENSRMKQTASAPLDSTVSSYAGLYNTTLADGVKGVYIDGYKGAHSMITELVYLKNGQLYTPFYDTTKGAVSSTLRNVTVSCEDINNDGVYDIPFAVELPGYEQMSYDSKLWLVRWCDYEDANTFKEVEADAINFNEGYCFELPKNWDGRLTAVNNAAKRQWVFRQADGNGTFTGKVLFEVDAFSETAWDKLKNRSRYDMAFEQNNSVYAVTNVTQDKSGMFLSPEQILDRLKVYNPDSQ